HAFQEQIRKRGDDMIHLLGLADADYGGDIPDLHIIALISGLLGRSLGVTITDNGIITSGAGHLYKGRKFVQRSQYQQSFHKNAPFCRPAAVMSVTARAICSISGRPYR